MWFSFAQRWPNFGTWIDDVRGNAQRRRRFCVTVHVALCPGSILSRVSFICRAQCSMNQRCVFLGYGCWRRPKTEPLVNGETTGGHRFGGSLLQTLLK
jgi:hypothetical protein